MSSDPKLLENCLQGCSSSNSSNEDSESSSSILNEASTSKFHKTENGSGEF